jgi:hypothetical protein
MPKGEDVPEHPGRERKRERDWHAAALYETYSPP